MKVLLLVIGVFLLASCSGGKDKPNIEVIQDMMEQPALKAQDYEPGNPQKSSMRVPPKGTWPKNVKPYLYRGNPIAAGQKLKNPYASNQSPEFTALGKRLYGNYCTVCHGPTGQGDGPVAEKFVGIKPPSLVTDKAKKLPDGQLFHIITDGQGLMGTYIHQLPVEKDRWAVVNYVRSLQR